MCIRDSHKGSARGGRRTNYHLNGGQPQAADQLGQPRVADRKPQGVSQRWPTDQSPPSQPGAADHMSQVTIKTQWVSQRWPTDHSPPHHQWGGQPQAADHRGQPEAADGPIDTAPPMGWSARDGRPSGQPEAADRKPQG
eukprot:5365305-Amphidinium_carterae.1